MATPQFTVPVLAYVGLQSQTTNAEIVAKGYTRRPATFDYMADGADIANIATIQWTVATAPWGVINTVLVFDLPTGGTLLASLPARAPMVSVDKGDIPRIQAGDIVINTASGRAGYGTGGFGRAGFGVGLSRRVIGGGVGTPYGVGAYGMGPYAAAAYSVTVPVEITFDDSGHVCAPGTWVKDITFQRAA